MHDAFRHVQKPLPTLASSPCLSLPDAIVSWVTVDHRTLWVQYEQTGTVVIKPIHLDIEY